MPTVPAAYRSWVAQASRMTGLPPTVVAAQINEESGFNPNATSPAGAQGIAQLEPGTWRTLGLPGTPFDPQAALQGYSKYMSQLLSQFHGNVRNALAAYNAGPGNLPAGYGYADTILSSAGSPLTITAGGSSTSSPSGAGAYSGLGGFLLKALLTIGLLFAGLALAGVGFNSVLGGRPARAARRAGAAAAEAA